LGPGEMKIIIADTEPLLVNILNFFLFANNIPIFLKKRNSQQTGLKKDDHMDYNNYWRICMQSVLGIRM